ncbi:MAG TPA: hypothetical protein VF202_08455 [Trueperaceae bacterium]|jgi:drug/metabolite transporter (DMT)-like permease
MAQTAAALVVGVVVAALAPGPPRPSGLLAWTLVALAVLLLPLGLASLARLAYVDSRQAALSRAIFAGVTLSTSSWFAALALATGQRGAPVLVLLAVLLLAYAAGFVGSGRLGRAAAAAPPRREAPGSA